MQHFAHQQAALAGHEQGGKTSPGASTASIDPKWAAANPDLFTRNPAPNASPSSAPSGHFRQLRATV